MTTTAKQSRAAAEKLGQIAHGFFASSALNAITRLHVADILQDQRLSLDELAKKTSTNRDALGRVLRLLCSLGIFEEVSTEVFANNETSNFMRADVEGSEKDMLLFIGNPFHFKAYTDMLPTLKDGRTASHHVWGKGIFDLFSELEEEQALFDKAMTSFSRRAVPQILAAYDFGSIETLVDVAGGHGALLTSILLEYPQMSGVLFDQPHVTPGAANSINELELSHRCEVVAGDFFKSVPGGDAIIMKHIIHDWDDDNATSILRNCRKALLQAGGRKLLLVEMLLPDTNEPHPGRFLDIEMLMLPGGKERTEQQFAELFENSGFAMKSIARTKGPWVVLEAIPAE